MEHLVRKALRPAAALLFVGLVAALAAFTLLQPVPPNGTAQAQGDGTNIFATSTRVAITIEGSNLGDGDHFAFSVPGYDGAKSDGSCTVAAMNSDGENIIAGDDGDSWACETGNSVVGSFEAKEGADADNFEVVITDVKYDATVGADPTNNRQATLGKTTGNAPDISGGSLGSVDSVVDGANTQTPFYLPGRNSGDSATASTTTARADVQVQLTVTRLPIDMPAGSSIVLFLEHDYFVPDPIGLRSTWFTVSGVAEPGKTAVSQPGRHYPTDVIEVDQDRYYAHDDDHSIRVYLPDLSPGTSDTTQGFQGAVAGQTLRLTFHKSAGIKNPSEAGSFQVGYAVLGPNDNVPSAPTYRLENLLRTYAKLSLSSDDHARGKTVVATGSGFPDGTTATLYVKHYLTAGRHPGGDDVFILGQSGDPNAALRGDDPNGAIMTPEETCADIIATGQEVGSALIGSDDRVEVEFQVNNPPFLPGNGNLLCMADSAGNTSSADVEHMNLDPCIRVTPESVNAGQTVTVTAVDYPAGATFRWLRVQGQPINNVGSPTSIGNNGKGSATFTMPGNISGRVSVSACWGGTFADGRDCDEESARIEVTASQLTLSKATVRPNESIVIRGSGFGTETGRDNDLESIEIDNAPMVLGSADNIADISVSNSGQFSTTVVVWSNAGNNPVLTPGAHTIRVKGKGGFTSTATITVVDPTVSVSPPVVGPREYVVISGADWPVTNRDGGDLEDVTVEISGGGITTDTERGKLNANGDWSIRYRVPGDVGIPSTLTVKATYGPSQDIVKLGTFSIPSADLTLTPSSTAPGADIVLNAGGLAPFESNIEVKIGSREVAVPTGATSNRAGDINNLVVKVPALDAGVYTVQLKVGATVAITELTVLEHTVGSTGLRDGLAPLGNNLVRVFYYNNPTKMWLFNDPRPDFDDLNTLTTLANGQPYWVLVRESTSVTLNGRAHRLTCLEGDCWNIIVW